MVTRVTIVERLESLLIRNLIQLSATVSALGKYIQSHVNRLLIMMVCILVLIQLYNNTNNIVLLWPIEHRLHHVTTMHDWPYYEVIL